MRHRRCLPTALLAAALGLAFGVAEAQAPRIYTYDDANRLTRVIYEDGTIVDYGYDLAGNRLAERVTPPGGPANSPPFVPSSPGVPDGATGVSITPTLTWTGGDPNAGDAVVYSVYLGPPGDLRLVYAGRATSFTAKPLVSLTAYAWRVVSRDSRGASTAGPTWGFTTGNAPPVADFGAYSTSGWAPLTVAFFDLSTAPDDAVVGWEWDFENDGVVDSTERNPTHTYIDAGTYTVTLRVSDAHGATGTRTRVDFIEVSADPDQDGILSAADNCASIWNPDQADADSDGVGDACDPDADGDGVPNASDNCPLDANPGQADADLDGFGDACTLNTCVATSAELQAALNAAGTDGRNSVVQLVRGTFGTSGNGGVSFGTSLSEPYVIVLRGGYAAGCGSRVAEPSNTVLDGEASSSVLALTSWSSAPMSRIVIEDLTIRNGFSSGAAGASLWALNGAVTIRRSVVVDNHASGDIGGLAASMERGLLTIDRVRVEGNTAGTRAGLSIVSFMADVLMTNSVFVRNAASGYAGAVGLSIHSGHARLVNNTITENSTDPTWGFGAGVYAEANDPSAVVDLHNNILWGNSAGIGADLYFLNFAGAAVSFGHNDIGQRVVEGTPAIETANIGADPFLVAAAAGDYHLSAESPCIDAGDSAAPGLPAIDFEGDARVLGTTADIGADEYYVSGPAYAISGRILESGAGVAGIRVQLSGDRAAERVTDTAGAYRFPWLPAGNFVVTPVDPFYAFAPALRAVTLVNADVAGRDFTASFVDTDGDGVPDKFDNCPAVGNADQLDSDSDGYGDACDVPGSISGRVTSAATGLPVAGAFVQANGYWSAASAPTGDYTVADLANGTYQVAASAAGYLTRYHPTAVLVVPGQDTPGINFALQPDTDGDGIADSADNCPGTINYDQADLDGDGVGDACDADLDGDGVPNATDNCVRDPNAGQADADGDGLGDVCTSVQCVATSADLQAALNAATADGVNDVIRLVTGVYTLTGNGGYAFGYGTYEPYGLFLLGGYAPGCATRVLDPANTVLDGESLGSVLALSQSGGFPFVSSLMEGLTIRNGRAYSDAGLSLTLANGSSVIRRSVVEGNVADGDGGGLGANVSGGSLTIDRTIFRNNVSSGNGGGMRLNVAAGDVLLTDNVTHGNTASWAGGGVGVYVYAGRVRIVNDTITGNASDPAYGYGGGVQFHCAIAAPSIEVDNTILWGNAAAYGADVAVSNGPGASISIAHSDLGNLRTDGASPALTANLAADPLFVDAAAGNYHLQSASPCIDAGNASASGIPAVDFEGDGRVLGFSADIGADEYHVAGSTYAIGGRVLHGGAGVPGIVVQLTGNASRTRTTDAAGIYRFTWLPAGSYVVTPVRTYTTFVPSQRAVTLTAADVLGQDFAADWADSDGDGVRDGLDNCPTTPNADQSNQDGDALGDACDCAPYDPYEPPSPVGNTVIVYRTVGSNATIQWSDDGRPGTFGAYRGHRDRPGPFAYNHACFGAPTTETSVTDGEVPGAGQVFYYLVSRIGCAESSLGTDKTGNPRPNPSPCLP
jgi:YD repeat-containing protein